MKNYTLQIREWSGHFVTTVTISAMTYGQAFRQLSKQYTNHRFTLVRVEPSEFSINAESDTAVSV